MKKTNAPKQVLPTENKRVAAVQFLKASKAQDTPERLTIEHIMRNTANRVMTSFIPDANVIIRMQQAAAPEYPATDKTLEHFGILEYTNILRQCVRNKLVFSVSPTFAFSELPEERSALALQRYYAFGQRFGIDWNDDPRASVYPNFGRKGVPSIWSVPIDQRAFFGGNYAYQLLMLVIRHTGKNRTPIENFTLYLEVVLNEVQILSARDLAIAMFLFANPRYCSEAQKNICTNIKNNFGKYDHKVPLTLETMDACALNSAYDMQMANFANLIDTNGAQGVKLDNWIITGDEKLIQYMGFCHHLNVEGFGAGSITMINTETSTDGYLQQAAELLVTTSLARQRNMPKLPTPDDMEDILHRVWDRSVGLLAETP